MVSLPPGRNSYGRLPLVFDPGSRWEYGPSTDILGILVESVSGLTLEDYFRRHIFDPLGMRDTRFQVSADDWARVAPTYQREADGGFGPAVLPLPAEPPRVNFFSGGGGLYSTAPDYIRFLRALLNGGRLGDARLLNAETVEMMARNHIGDHEAGIVTSNRPDWLRDVNFFPDSQGRLRSRVSHQYGAGRPWKGGRKPGLGRFDEYLLLARSELRYPRRRHDANSALCRPVRADSAGRVRKDRILRFQKRTVTGLAMHLNACAC